MTGMELTYAYPVASAVRRGGGGSELLLGTSGGRTESGPVAHPHLFHGFLTDPRPAALGMLACLTGPHRNSRPPVTPGRR